MLFHEMSHFLQISSEKLIETSKRDSLLEKLQVLAKSTIFHAFFTKTSERDSLLEKLSVLAKSTIFQAFSRNEPLFANFFRKVDQNFET